MIFLAATVAQAQITIGGSVYGGGNAGDTKGSTTVTVRAGDINEVYGGARMADVKGSAFVNIDGAQASNYIVINKVYGGNDVAGTIGSNDAAAKKFPSDVLTLEVENHVTNVWDADLQHGLNYRDYCAVGGCRPVCSRLPEVQDYGGKYRGQLRRKS